MRTKGGECFGGPRVSRDEPVRRLFPTRQAAGKTDRTATLRNRVPGKRGRSDGRSPRMDPT